MATIKGMKRNGLTYVDGTITDPRDSSVYRALMNLMPITKPSKSVAISGSLYSAAPKAGKGCRMTP